jgi:hypothetical protein
MATTQKNLKSFISYLDRCVQKDTPVSISATDLLAYILLIEHDAVRQHPILQKILTFLEPHEKWTGYGSFPGGNPNEFEPDTSCATTGEIAAHKAACDAWNAQVAEGKTPEDLKTSHLLSADESGNMLHVAFSQFGLGAYTVTEPEIMALCNEIRQLIGVTK